LICANIYGVFDDVAKDDDLGADPVPNRKAESQATARSKSLITTLTMRTILKLESVIPS